MRYQGLDGLRALAVLGVICTHTQILQSGQIGVDLFFVLSGFLITGILLDAHPFGLRALRPFYLRRALRIMPLAYAALLLLAWHLPWNESRWYYTYTIDLRSTRGAAVYLNHFWSLALEEQFYFIWPIVALTCPRRYFGIVCLLLLGLTLAARLELVRLHVWRTWNAEHLRTDGLIAGALLAHVVRVANVRSWRLPATIVGVAAYGAWLMSDRLPARDAFLIDPLFLAMSFVSVLLLVLTNCPMWLKWRPLEYVGTISYGIYVIHNPIAWMLERHGLNRWSNLLVTTVATVTIASVSWFCFERPILMLKERWPMPRVSPSGSGQMAAAAAECQIIEPT
jgi:peptidoglycan/LPS O-acetylase OafA/YrhL